MESHSPLQSYIPPIHVDSKIIVENGKLSSKLAAASDSEKEKEMSENEGMNKFSPQTIQTTTSTITTPTIEIRKASLLFSHEKRPNNKSSNNNSVLQIGEEGEQIRDLDEMKKLDQNSGLLAASKNHLASLISLNSRNRINSSGDSSSNEGTSMVYYDEDIVELEAPPEFVPKPPDGGWGWMIVLASFFCNMVVDGICYTVGILYQDLEKSFPDVPVSKLAWIGSLLSGMYLCVGPIVSAMTNRFGCRPVTIVGGFIASFSFLIAMFSPTVDMLILTYGVLGGIGFGLIYLPAIVSVGYYFEKKRAFATGMAVCGSGVGTFIFGPLTKFLLDKYGWRGSLAIYSGIILNSVVMGALMRPLPLPKPPKVKPLLQRIKEDKDARMKYSSDPRLYRISEDAVIEEEEDEEAQEQQLEEPTETPTLETDELIPYEDEDATARTKVYIHSSKKPPPPPSLTPIKEHVPVTNSTTIEQDDKNRSSIDALNKERKSVSHHEEINMETINGSTGNGDEVSIESPDLIDSPVATNLEGSELGSTAAALARNRLKIPYAALLASAESPSLKESGAEGYEDYSADQVAEDTPSPTTAKQLLSQMKLSLSNLNSFSPKQSTSFHKISLPSLKRKPTTARGSTSTFSSSLLHPNTAITGSITHLSDSLLRIKYNPTASRISLPDGSTFTNSKLSASSSIRKARRQMASDKRLFRERKDSQLSAAATSMGADSTADKNVLLPLGGPRTKHHSISLSVSSSNPSHDYHVVHRRSSLTPIRNNNKEVATAAAVSSNLSINKNKSPKSVKSGIHRVEDAQINGKESTDEPESFPLNAQRQQQQREEEKSELQQPAQQSSKISSHETAEESDYGDEDLYEKGENGEGEEDSSPETDMPQIELELEGPLPDVEDFSRPLYKKDIFYGGSVTNLPEYRSQLDPKNYYASMTSIPVQIATASVGGDGAGFLPPTGRPSFVPGVARPRRLKTRIRAFVMRKLCPCLGKRCSDTLSEMTDLTLFREPVFLLICLANILAFAGFYVPFVYTVGLAKQIGIPDSQSSLLVSIIGGANIIGRLLFGYLTDLPRVDSILVNNICTTIVGISTILCPLCKSFITLSLNLFVFGLSVAAFISLTSIVLVDLMGIDRLTNAFGLLLLCRGVTSIIGPPLAGWIYDKTGSYDCSFYVSGAFLVCAGIVSFTLRPVQKRYVTKLTSNKRKAEEAQAALLAIDGGATIPLKESPTPLIITNGPTPEFLRRQHKPSFNRSNLSLAPSASVHQLMRAGSTFSISVRPSVSMMSGSHPAVDYKRLKGGESTRHQRQTKKKRFIPTLKKKQTIEADDK